MKVLPRSVVNPCILTINNLVGLGVSWIPVNVELKQTISSNSYEQNPTHAMSGLLVTSVEILLKILSFSTGGWSDILFVELRLFVWTWMTGCLRRCPSGWGFRPSSMPIVKISVVCWFGILIACTIAREIGIVVLAPLYVWFVVLWQGHPTPNRPD
jgi:hypothetical protein